MQIPDDPVARYAELLAALKPDRGWFQNLFTDVAPLRFAAIAVVTTDGTAAEVADGVHAIAEELKERSGWFGELNGSMRFIVAAVLLQNSDTAADFLTAVEATRAEFRRQKLKRGGAYEAMAALILRGPEKQAIPPGVVDRFKAIYEEMSRHQWWLTGVDDFPACAVLTRKAGEPQAIGAAVEAIYQALHAAGFKKGNPLQTAANLLYLAGETPEVIAARCHALAEAFRAERTRVWQSEYDELAVLAFLDRPTDEVVQRVLRNQAAIRELAPRPDRALAFNLASSLAFVELVREGAAASPVAETKAMLDLQAILNAQQAAAVAASVAATSAATASS